MTEHGTVIELHPFRKERIALSFPGLLHRDVHGLFLPHENYLALGAGNRRIKQVLGEQNAVRCEKRDPAIDFAVADCGFSDIENVLREGYKNANAPTFLVDIANIGAKLRYHYAIKDMRPIDSLNDNQIPVLFIHGEDDTFIPPKNSQDMYDRTKGQREIYFIPKAGHAESILTNPEAYHAYVKGFLQEIG